MEPTLRVPYQYKEYTESFGGLNRNVSVSPGEFREEENLSSDQYPVLTVRPPRKKLEETGQALLAGEGLIRVEGSDLVLPSRRVPLELTREGEKTLSAMGSYILVFPDKKYASILEEGDYGSMEACFQAQGPVTATPCTLDGTKRLPDYIGTQPPEDPENGQVWLDTSGNVLKVWSGTSGMWIQEETGYIRLERSGIGRDFRQYDGVRLEDCGALNGANTVWAREEDALVVAGTLAEDTELNGLVIRRVVPDMDYVTECGNRLWGCRAGKNREGKTVNEIYACKLGDFRNWESFLGLSTDSYSVGVGSPGGFTGAVTYLGTPIFFKEDCLYKVYGSYPAAYRLQMTACAGVQAGCAGSLAIAGETLYYKSNLGVCAYEGAMPRDIGRALGAGPFRNALGAAWGSLYYLSMEDAEGENGIYVYDGTRNLWHRETGMAARCLTGCQGKLYALDGEGALWCLRGEEGEERVSWTAQTGKLDYCRGGRYLTGLSLRMELAKRSQAEISIRYDGSGPWEPAGTVVGQGQTFSLMVRPRRCSAMELRLQGTGPMRLYGMERIWQRGGRR